MAKTALVTWGLPTTRESGNALTPAEIAGVDIDFAVERTDGGSPVFTNLGRRMPTATQDWSIPDLDAGNWIVRLTVEDTAGKKSTPVDTVFTVADETNPSGVVNVTVALS